jgi:hypothetical protein
MDSSEKPPEVQIPTGNPIPNRASERSTVFQLEGPTEVPPPILPPIAPPPVPSAPVPTNSGGSRATLWVLGTIVGLVALIAMFDWANSSGNSTSSTYSGSRSSSGGSYTPATAQAHVPPPVSKALDEKNGFKDFYFGMTVSEANEVLEPTRTFRNEGAKSETLLYLGTAVNRIGEFSMDSVGLQFFEGILYRIDISFSSFQNEIFETLKIIYGEPSDNSSWTRGTQTLKAKCWVGEKTYAAIVGPTDGPWDAIIIYDQAANQKAREYADTEPVRAAKDFSTNGFKTLKMGMSIKEITADYTVTENSAVTGIKQISISQGELLRLGSFRLQSVRCAFFNDKLYRIDLGFDQERQEVLKTFESRFGPLQNNDTWTRGALKLTAKSGGSDQFFGAILAPGGGYNGEEWDSIVLLNLDTQRAAEQFKRDAPKRAAKDLLASSKESEEKPKEAGATPAKPRAPMSPAPAGRLDDFFTQGSHKDDVIRLQGTPDSIQRYEFSGYEVWVYGLAHVDISIRDGRVLKWWNSGDRLKVSMTPGKKTTESTSFTQGSHKDDVIRLQGTPDSIQQYEFSGYEVWAYGSANVDISIRDGRVLKWWNSGDRLKVSNR